MRDGDTVCWLREQRLNTKLTLYLAIDSEMLSRGVGDRNEGERKQSALRKLRATEDPLIKLNHPFAARNWNSSAWKCGIEARKVVYRELLKTNGKHEAESCFTYVALSSSLHVLTPVTWTPDTSIIPQERLFSWSTNSKFLWKEQQQSQQLSICTKRSQLQPYTRASTWPSVEATLR